MRTVGWGMAGHIAIQDCVEGILLSLCQQVVIFKLLWIHNVALICYDA